jgi:hypothetical protein
MSDANFNIFPNEEVHTDTVRSQIVKLAMQGHGVQIRPDGNMYCIKEFTKTKTGEACEPSRLALQTAMQPGVQAVDKSMMVQVVPLLELGAQFRPELQRRHCDGPYLWCDEDGAIVENPVYNSLATVLFGNYIHGSSVYGTVVLTCSFS